MRDNVSPRLLWTEANIDSPARTLADDHREFLEAESALLRPYFDLVGTASDGRSLVSEVQRLKPDVVVVDITMPVMNGIDAVRKLIESGSTAKFVFLTINTDEEFVKACLSGGCSGLCLEVSNEGPLDPGDSMLSSKTCHIFLH